METNLANANPEKTTSAARIAANQANALKSTGPKTGEGRIAAKMNALKHGIFSSEILVHGRHIQENHEELAALHQRMLDAYHPVGVAEEMLVDQLVSIFWRTRRLQKAEAGEIALSVDIRQIVEFDNTEKIAAMRKATFKDVDDLRASGTPVIPEAWR
jgi:hypothetical protein